MRGIITFILNRSEQLSLDGQRALIDNVRKLNTELINELQAMGFKIMFITTTNEASRIEKVEFANPIPLVNLT